MQGRVFKSFGLLGIVGGLSSLTVQAQFTTIQIGGGATGSIVTNGPASFTVIGGGNDIWGAGDAFTFHYFLLSGNFDMRTRIESLEPNAPSTKAGLMARETPATNSRMAYCRVTPVGPTSNGQTGLNDVRFGYRTGTTSAAQGQHADPLTGFPAPAYPDAWVRLLRIGNSVAAYSSANGSTWTLLGTQDTTTWSGGPLTSTLGLGLAACRGSNGASSTARAEFRQYANVVSDPVTITAQPTNQTVAEGQTATFNVQVAGGDDAFQFRWRHNGMPIPGATNAIFTTPPAMASDDGTAFSVVVSNVFNTSKTTSAVAILTVTMPPTITSQPQNMTNCPNTTAAFSVTATGTTPLSYQWRKGSANIPGATSSSYTIASVQPSNAGTYSVVITNSAGSTTSSNATLTVRTLTTAAGPSSLTNCPGTSAAFSTMASGSGPFSYQWSKDGMNLSGATGPAYTVGAVSAADAGTYCVVVSGACNSVTNCAALTVLSPTTASGPDPATVCQGTTATFAITASGTGPFSHAWVLDGNPIGTDSPTLNVTTDTLTVGSHVVAVVVSGVCGAVTNSTTLTIDQTTSATPLMSLARAGGDSATFSTAPSGTGPFSFRWIKDGVMLTGVTGDSYTISSVTPSDGGTYCVVVSGACNSVTNCATLTVNTPPVLAPMADQTIHEGTLLTLSMSASDAETPADSLTYSLVDGPLDCSLHAADGFFTWNPTVQFVDSTQLVTIRVSDDGTPGLSDEKTFAIRVVSRPVLGPITLLSNGVRLTWSAITGQTYRAQYTPNLNALPQPTSPGEQEEGVIVEPPTVVSRWTNLPGVVTAAGPTAQIEDTSGVSTQRFYGVRAEYIPLCLPGERLEILDEWDGPARYPTNSVIAGYEDGTGPNNGIWNTPDPVITVGKSHVIAAVNDDFIIYQKDGTVLTTNDANALFGPLAAGGNDRCFDPQLAYDPWRSRYLILYAMENGSRGVTDNCTPGSTTTAQAVLLLAVSKDRTPTNGWWTYSIDATVNDCAYWADFPKLGFDANAVYITATMRRWSDLAVIHTKLMILNKDQIYEGIYGGVQNVDFYQFRNTDFQHEDGSLDKYLVPVHMWSSSPTMYLIGANRDGDSKLSLYRITWPVGRSWADKWRNGPGDPSLEEVPLEDDYEPGPNAVQPNTNIKLDVGPPVLLNATYYQGLIYTAHTVNGKDYDDGEGNRAAIRLYVFFPRDCRGAGPSDPCVDRAYLWQDYVYGFKGWDYFSPAVTHTIHGDMIITFSRSNKDYFARTRVTAWRVKTGADAPETSQLVKAGLSEFTTGGASEAPWGDYYGAALDPANQCTVFIIGEYPVATNFWGTWIGKVR